MRRSRGQAAELERRKVLQLAGVIRHRRPGAAEDVDLLIHQSSLSRCIRITILWHDEHDGTMSTMDFFRIRHRVHRVIVPSWKSRRPYHRSARTAAAMKSPLPCPSVPPRPASPGARTRPSGWPLRSPRPRPSARGFEHQRRRSDRADRVRDVLPRQRRRRAVDRLEHRRAFRGACCPTRPCRARPATLAPRSVTMSPNRLLVTMT